jgi:mycothiol synthase
VVPTQRGRGLGDALLRTAFAEFWRRGERRVALGVAADNPGATRLYERAGMRVAHTIVLYEKELRSAG